VTTELPPPSWRVRLAQKLTSAWTRRGPVAYALLPVAGLFGLLRWVRTGLYRCGILSSTPVEAVVIVVGNAVAGGAGKTPTVVELVQHLQAQGYRVGIISRGYARHDASCQEVKPDTPAHTIGDEPLLLKRKTGVPVFVSTRRVQAAQQLQASYPETDVIISDDGLQHLALQRDLEICVFDARGTGNGFLLPAGPLREPWPRAVHGHATPCLVLHTGQEAAFPGYRASRTLAPFAVRADGTHVPLQDLQTTTPLPLLAVAGIANPQVFFTMLQTAGWPIAKTMALPDHYDFDSYSSNIYEGYLPICTEKDAVKLWRHRPDALAVPLVQHAEPAFWQALDSALRPVLTKKLSSRHGHTTS
jgi:tetraacyldisaccharide 4'-kinase